MDRIRAITSGPKHHLCGYYGVPPWDRAMRYHLEGSRQIDVAAVLAAVVQA
jgi:hypothetical protein